MIEELFAYVYWDDQQEQEMILGWETAPGISHPCISPDLENVKGLGQLALSKAIRAGKTVRLVKFSSREVLFSRGPLEMAGDGWIPAAS